MTWSDQRARKLVHRIGIIDEHGAQNASRASSSRAPRRRSIGELPPRRAERNHSLGMTVEIHERLFVALRQVTRIDPFGFAPL